MFYLIGTGGSDQVPNGNPNTIYFHAPNDPPGKWHSLHEIAAKVSTNLAIATCISEMWLVRALIIGQVKRIKRLSILGGTTRPIWKALQSKAI